MHFLTHWLYARAHRYDVLVYMHPTTAPSHLDLGYFFYFFLKAPATQGALFTLGYDYVLAIDWDTYAAPLSAPPLEALMLQWPRKALYVQATGTFNAGATPCLEGTSRTGPRASRRWSR
jgi:hypothetical protein